MISAGNDIVSLDIIDVARTKQPRFYSKIISVSERSIYSNPGFDVIAFEHFVWLLWSIKESAYKYIHRLQPELVFTPIMFKVQQLDIPVEFKLLDFDSEEVEGTGFDGYLTLNGIISVGMDRLYSRSLIYKKAIMTVVNSSDRFNNIYWGMKIISNANYDSQSSAVRECLLCRLKNITGFHDFSIVKNALGVPVLSEGAVEMTMPVSLSHHGHLVAYSFQLGDH